MVMLLPAMVIKWSENKVSSLPGLKIYLRAQVQDSRRTGLRGRVVWTAIAYCWEGGLSPRGSFEGSGDFSGFWCLCHSCCCFCCSFCSCCACFCPTAEVAAAVCAEFPVASGHQW